MFQINIINFEWHSFSLPCWSNRTDSLFASIGNRAAILTLSSAYCSTCCATADSWSRYMMGKGGWFTCRNNRFFGAFLMLLEPSLWWLAQVLYWSQIRLGRGVIAGHTMCTLVGIPWSTGSNMPDLLDAFAQVERIWVMWIDDNGAYRDCLYFHCRMLI